MLKMKLSNRIFKTYSILPFHLQFVTSLRKQFALISNVNEEFNKKGIDNVFRLPEID